MAIRPMMVVVTVALAVLSGTASADAPERAGVGAFIVVLHDRVDDAAAVAGDHGQRYGVQVERVYTAALKGYAGSVDRRRLDALRRDPSVRFVQEDGPVQAFGQQLPTGVDRIDAELNRTAAIDGHDDRVDVDVAVLDSGVDVDHPDLDVVGGYNCTSPQQGTQAFDDRRGHGTHVAGTLGALDNDLGVVGVAPGARIWAVKVLGNDGSGLRSWIICGIDFVTANADVIEVANMSLGGPGADDGDCGLRDGDAEHLAICRSVAAGVTYVVAAGNSARDAAGVVPAAYDEVITVSALADFDGQPGGLAAPTCGLSDVDDTFADFSNFGADIDLIAPGTCILSTLPREGALGSVSGYGWGVGTSMAAPHVAGSAAVYRATNPDASPADVQAALQRRGSRRWDDPDDPDGTREPLVHAARL